MKISVISPSYNQVQFLPDNLRTVAAQKGVEVEHIIVDPGSTDGSTELARQASHAILINEPDRGQSHGITKGYTRATGDVLVWLNSDDFYPDDTVLAKVAAAFKRHPEADIIYGDVNFVDENGAFLRKGFVNRDSSNLLKSFEYQVGIVQPGVFMRRKVFEAVGGPSEDYNYCMDYEYWVRKAVAGFRWVFLDEVLAHHRWWPGMKTASGRGDSLVEHFKVGTTYFGYIHHKWLDRYGEFLASDSDGVVNTAEGFDPHVKTACVRRAIERFVTQDMLAQLERSTDKEQRDTLEYIRRIAPGHRRYAFDTAELVNPVSTHPEPMAEQRVAWHIFDTKDSGKRAYKTYTVPNNFSRSFDRDWYYFQHERAKEKLYERQARRKDICVVVANGPSLTKSNLDLLDQADVIISNYAIISRALRKHATYLTVVNDLVAKQGSVQFNGLDTLKVLPFWLANSMNATESTIFLPATVTPKFCTEIGGNFSWRSTVSFLNMQLAYALGYERVVLIGFDHSYQQASQLKEGDSIDQKEEDPNHFDPRYFQGKTWQAADTVNMEKMYVVARDAYAATGRSIVNATVGGKLEVFPRMTLEAALGLDRPGRVYPVATHPFPAPVPVTVPAGPPRLLVLDMTAAGNGTATGEIKSNLLADWPADRLLQIAKQGPHGLATVQRAGAGWSGKAVDVTAARQAVVDFRPDVILYRPVPDTAELHSFAMELIRAERVPLITWIMDDWPARMEAENPAAWAAMKPDLDMLLKRSALRLSISEAMSEAYAKRYGVPFVPLANGIDPVDWPTVPKPSAKDGIFRLRYAGGLAPDMNRKSLYQIAEAVERIGASGQKISFQISTQKWWLDQVKNDLAKFPRTQLLPATMSQKQYRNWISQADALVIAYNFDAASLRYIRYSLANKTPECLVSGAPILAYGPQEAATIRYLADGDLARVVAQEGVDAVEAALRQMIAAPQERASLAGRARVAAGERHDVRRLRQVLSGLVADACRGQAAGTPPSSDTAPSPIGATDSDDVLLLRLAQELLLDRVAGLSRLEADATLRARVEAAKRTRPANDSLVLHLNKVLAHVGRPAPGGQT